MDFSKYSLSNQESFTPPPPLLNRVTPFRLRSVLCNCCCCTQRNSAMERVGDPNDNDNGNPPEVAPQEVHVSATSREPPKNTEGEPGRVLQRKSIIIKRQEEAEPRATEAQNQLARLVAEKNTEIATLLTRLERAESAARAATTKLQVAESRAHNAEKRSSYLQARLQKEGQEARSEFEALETKIRSLTRDLEGSETTVRHLIDQLTQDKVDGRWNPSADQDIRDSLSALDAKVKSWAKEWANTTFRIDALDPAAARKLIKNIAQFVQLLPDGSLPSAIGRPSARLKEKLPVILLSATVAREIQMMFFKDPFFCSASRSEALQAVLQTMAIVWAKTNKEVQAYCEEVDNDYCKEGELFPLLAPVQSDRERQNRSAGLRAILMEAAWIAQRLWSQPTYLQTVDLPWFQRQGVTFDISSPLMQAHTMNRVDHDNPAHNGRKILMVTRPGLSISEGDDVKGLDGDQYRVLAKAIVWLEEGPLGSER
ncbi:hypothetical protein HRR90_001856 [Exophiala dermatitidis]|nr:hypothetical protein HRR73_000788 [Exophiala dermatitidis]KAJ4583134.1 hypothetical protein HRR81_001869 [Exophiala dermatitidis]KAJ4587897.1 hypothetical protein HRR82_001690 [Exophiala dermatitidis]KAJ4659499.1 hypothetical protein HRR90_001856 [Exophiala dermatitidis]KAJ4681581.1 hypothetical protein HRR95_003632 [Exophiala dermatitidis]